MYLKMPHLSRPGGSSWPPSRLTIAGRQTTIKPIVDPAKKSWSQRLPQSTIPAPVLKWLTFSLAALVSATGVSLGVFGMAHALGDQTAGKWLWRVSVALMMGLAIDLLLLVGVLAIRQIESDSDN